MVEELNAEDDLLGPLIEGEPPSVVFLVPLLFRGRCTSWVPHSNSRKIVVPLSDSIKFQFANTNVELEERKTRRDFLGGKGKEGEGGGVVNDGFALFVFCSSTPNRHFLCHLGIHLILRHGNSPSRSIKSPRDLIGKREKGERTGRKVSAKDSLFHSPSLFSCPYLPLPMTVDGGSQCVSRKVSL